MARWGDTIPWGTFVWGDVVETADLLWFVDIDWNRDNHFDGSNEARLMFDIKIERGRKTMLKNTGSGFQSLMPGKCTIKLRNNDGRYDGWNEDSSIYPYVKYGPEVRIRNALQSDGVMKDVFYGQIVDIRPYGYGGDAYVEIEIEEMSRKLRESSAACSIEQNLTPGAAIERILDAAKWQNRWGRNIDAGTGNIPFHWASGSKKALTELEDLSNSFLGIFFIAADGRATFIDRNTVPSSTLELDQSLLLKDISMPQPWYNERTVTRLKAHPRRAAALGVIYRVEGDSILVEAGRSRTIWPNYSYNNQPTPAINVEQPVGSTDYFAFANADGTGTDYTANCTMTLTDFGDNAKLVIRNTGGFNFYVTERQIKGQAIYEEDIDDITYPEDISDVEDQRTFVQDLPWQQSVNEAFDYSQVLGAFLAQLHPFPVVKLRGRHDIQFALDLFNVVPTDIEKLGLVGVSFRVGGISHQSKSETLQDIETKLYLEPYLTSGTYWTWPITDFGTDTIFGW